MRDITLSKGITWHGRSQEAYVEPDNLDDPGPVESKD